MPSGLLSNLNSFGFFRRAVGVKPSRPLHLISRKNPPLASVAAPDLLNYSNNKCNKGVMAAFGSISSSGDLVVDKLVSNCGSFTSFVNPSAVFFNYRSDRVYGKARVCLRNRETESPIGVKGCAVFNFKRSYCICSPIFLKGYRNLSSISDGVSTDESLSVDEQLSNLAISAEKIQCSSVLKLLSGACYMPHPAKEATGGEDAHFICADEQAIGIADGVGGWADVGVNAGLYARELMSNSVKAIQEARNGDVAPLQVLEFAHAKTKAMGSSTACIITLKNKSLHAINLGDSGFLVIRDGSIIFESPVQQHGFNFTYQLENSDRGDLPSSGQVFEISVTPGDIVIAGSDGLFDNLFSKEIANTVADAVKEGLSPDAMAKKIAAFARVRALDNKHQSPFSDAAQKAGFSFYGGKLDDLTVVVSYVSTSA